MPIFALLPQRSISRDFQNTHTGEIVDDLRLKLAFWAVAGDLVLNAHAIRKEDLYASHITEDQKKSFHKDNMDYAHAVHDMTAPVTFTLWQRVNEKITGKCIALLPSSNLSILKPH